MEEQRFKRGQDKTYQQLSAYTALLARLRYMTQLGLQYGGDRDVYQALGYPKDLTYENFFTRYVRQDIAKAIINRPVQATWGGTIRLEQGAKDDETDFERSWRKLWKRLKLKNRFIRLDKLAHLGRYGVLLFGFDDVKNLAGWEAPVRSGARRLLYLKAFGESNAQITRFEDNPRDQRFGYPLFYEIRINNQNGNHVSLKVHHTRVLHVAGELLESDIYGTPVLESVYNRLVDLEKLVGASAEMFWRGARPGYQGVVNPDYTISEPTKNDLRNQIREYEHDLRRIIINEGIELKGLESQVSEPQFHVEVQLMMISAVTGIPKRVLVGSERGELASLEDKTAWLDLIQRRRKEFAEEQLLTPFIEKCVEHAVLPPLDEVEYQILWPDLFAPSEKERAEIGKIRAQALQSYMNNPAAAVVLPPALFYEYMLGLTEEDIAYLKRQHTTSVTDDLTQIFDLVSKTQQLKAGQGRAPALPPGEE